MTQVVAGQANQKNEINIADAAGQFATDPSLLFNNDMLLQKQTSGVPTQQQMVDGSINNPSLQQGNDPSKFNAETQTVDNTSTVNQQTATQAAPVTTQTTQQDVANNQMEAAQGQVNQNSQINTDGLEIDTDAVANAQTATGQALKDYAKQDLSTIIDTSTVAGKMLAQTLGEGNYVDSKATLKGQLDILQNEFIDPVTGDPKIPAWAAATARSVGRIAAFKGMTGTAATAAMAQALMEASLPVAQQDAQFFQTLTLKNLDNKQEATINRANVLAKMDLANMDMRMTAAVENANKFMQMDLANLSNEQQARTINTQARVQSILEDAKAENTKRLFMAESQNDLDKFYSSLNSSIDQFNASQQNQMKQFNASEENATNKFNADLENNREQFYKDMQFNIDVANAKWRQTITLQKDQQAFDAAATDVKNKVGISTEMLNRIWDRSDALLDYAWKTADNEADRKTQINLMKLQNQQAIDEANATGTGNLLGTLLGIAGNAVLGIFGW